MMNILNFLVKTILIYSYDILKAVPNVLWPETKGNVYIDNYKKIEPTMQWRATQENVYIDIISKKK